MKSNGGVRRGTGFVCAFLLGLIAGNASALLPSHRDLVAVVVPSPALAAAGERIGAGNTSLS